MDDNEAMFSPTMVVEPIEPAKKKKKRVRLTKAQRDAKIAAGWNPPGPRPRRENGEMARSKLTGQTTSVEDGGREYYDRAMKAESLLKLLVNKLVAMENDPQYRGVWTHFFVHGGVYNGPTYLDELTMARDYIVGKMDEKTTMGDKS